jgi:hypothetical protein
MLKKKNSAKKMTTFQICSNLKQLALGLVSFSKKVRSLVFESMYSNKACSHIRFSSFLTVSSILLSVIKEMYTTGNMITFLILHSVEYFRIYCHLSLSVSGDGVVAMDMNVIKIVCRLELSSDTSVQKLGMFLPSGIREKGSYPVWGLYKVLISVIA